MITDHYLSDVPIASRQADRLNRWPFAARIADVLATRSDPRSLVVGVYGRWGEGKTTVLEFIEQRLTEHESVIVVRFNPWLFANDTELFVGFFAQLAGAIDCQLESTKGKIGEILKTYGGLLAGLSGIDLSKLGEELAKSTPQDLRKRLEQALAEKKTRIVVLLDDLDRLDKHEAQAVFRLLKVAADFCWTSYVLAFDPEVVADALSERYARRRDGGDEFLDKIVQVPLPLPPAPSEVLRKLVFDEINRVLHDSKIELSEREVSRFVTEFEAHLLHRVETPRASKRYANAIQFAVPMLQGEVDVVDLLLIEAVRVFHPRLHAFVARNREIVLHAGARHQASKDVIEAFKTELAALSGPGPQTTNDIQLLEGLFPRLKGIYRNTSHDQGWEQRWAKEKRIASVRYFSRYFSSGIPAGDVADADIQASLSIAVVDISECARRLESLLDDVEADRLVQKIFDAVHDAEGDRALAIAGALARVGMRFPHPPGAFSRRYGPRGRLAGITASLLTRALAGHIADASEVLEDAPLPFALEVFRSLQPEDTNGSDDGTANADWLTLATRLIPRVREEAMGEWPFAHGFEEGRFRVALWRKVGDAREVVSYILQQVGQDSHRALDIVRMFTRSGHNLTTGERAQSLMQPDEYESLKSLVDPARLAPPLVRLFDSPPDETESGGLHNATDSELAHSFLRLHAAATPTEDPDGSQSDMTRAS